MNKGNLSVSKAFMLKYQLKLCAGFIKGLFPVSHGPSGSCLSDSRSYTQSEEQEEPRSWGKDQGPVVLTATKQMFQMCVMSDS